MRTLDEVIAMAEHCWQPMPESLCATCPSENKTNKCRLYSDILYYLKEYKKLDSLDAIAFPEDDNSALTWDELRQMEGKPVWVEEIEDDKILFGQWDIVSGFGYSENFDLIDYENPIINFYISGNRTKFGLGKTWQAYRKER